MPASAITIAILAMGGEGGGVLADWIVDLAEHAGFYAQTTSVPGVAQRTGSTIYYLELFPAGAPDAAGRDPVLALMPVPGELDIVIASELMEAGRAIQRGLVTPNRTTLIASTHRVYTMTEKTAAADGRVDPAAFIEAGAIAAKNFIRADFGRIAEANRSVISAALLGALAATGTLPFRRSQFEDAIRTGGVGVDSSLSAFAEGFQAATEASNCAPPNCAPPNYAAPLTDTTSGGHMPNPAAPLPGSDVKPALTRFPVASHPILAAGYDRLAAYQDSSYAAEYLEMLYPVRDADTEHGNGEFTLLRETGRYLALWMSYEDAIRVADLKTQGTRFERVRREARATPAQIVRIHEFVHPGVAEIADILPAALGRWLLSTGWARRFVERRAGKGKVIETTSLAGFLQLYALAALRPWRRRSLRWQRELAKSREWLAQIPALAAEDYALACEAAKCPRLLKGYGETYVAGVRRFDAVMSALPGVRCGDRAAQQFERLREAALAGDDRKLTDALQELNGAPR